MMTSIERRADIERRAWIAISRRVKRYRKETEFIVYTLMRESGLNQTALAARCAESGICTQGKARDVITKLGGICWAGLSHHGNALIYEVTETGLIHYRANHD